MTLNLSRPSSQQKTKSEATSSTTFAVGVSETPKPRKQFLTIEQSGNEDPTQLVPERACSVLAQTVGFPAKRVLPGPITSSSCCSTTPDQGFRRNPIAQNADYVKPQGHKRLLDRSKVRPTGVNLAPPHGREVALRNAVVRLPALLPVGLSRGTPCG